VAALFTESELAEKLADRGVMRVRIAGREIVSGRISDSHGGPGTVLERVRHVAPHATWSGSDLVVPGPVAQRPRVLAELQACGAELLAITAEEGRLDSFYRELLAGE
jgi:hypothetical protein